MDRTQLYNDLRDTIAQLVFLGNQSGKATDTLQRYQELISLYDTVCKIDSDGCVFAVYGSPKMGKSTLFNSIMGAEVLPNHPIPTTGSIIDLKKDKERRDYEVTCKRNGKPFTNHFREPKQVCEHLDKYATQKNPFNSVTVTGPFPDAADFVTDKCILRDTPGAEACMDTTARDVDDLLRRDSQTALASLNEPCIPLFCVNAKTIGQGQDRDFYQKYFKNRFCLHVLTHIDAISQDIDSQEVLKNKDDFMEKFDIIQAENEPKPIVCTGIRDMPGGDTMVNIGKEGLVAAMKKLISPTELGKIIRDIAVYIRDNGVDWKKCGQEQLLIAQLTTTLERLK